MKNDNYQLHSGDCLELLATLQDNSVDSIVTDPPYGLSFMGKKWDYDVPKVEIWKECLRVLKPGGHLLAFAGTRTQHRMAVRIEDAGFEIRDMIAWVYGSGFPKSLNLKDDWQGWGTALKPALEPITVARKPLVGTVAANLLEHGTGAINVDGCRVWTDDGRSRSRPPRTPNAILGGGKGTNLTASEHNDLGRWPANLIHDGSEEVIGLFPGEEGKSAARFFYCAKASKKDRDEGLEGFAEATPGEMTDRVDGSAGLNNPRSGAGRTGGGKNVHPTVKPTELMRYLCRLVTPPGGVVLDPFTGSGSTGKAAILEGFRFLGAEMNPEYVAIAKARIDAAVRLI